MASSAVSITGAQLRVSSGPARGRPASRGAPLRRAVSCAASPPSLPRRAALLAPGLAMLLQPQRRSSAAELASEGIFGERFQQCPATFTVPDDWKSRPGQRAKMEKYVLYTDTYGPVFRYTRTFPRLLDGEGVLTCDRIQVQASPAKDAVDITDLGALEAIDAPNAFGIEAKNGDLRLADTASAEQRTDGDGVIYYDWQLNLPSEGVMLLSAAVTGGGLYVLSLDSTSEQWARNQDSLKAAQASFSVVPAEESRADLSSRIYNSAPSMMK
mmetsp:Transcript_32276/g.83631  ORF Transcript_32276/g.83631 Transcript_32276/m.83631 type:complete len:270 (-) Transcript_32276:170-979(-)